MSDGYFHVEGVAYCEKHGRLLRVHVMPSPQFVMCEYCWKESQSNAPAPEQPFDIEKALDEPNGHLRRIIEIAGEEGKNADLWWTTVECYAKIALEDYGAAFAEQRRKKEIAAIEVEDARNEIAEQQRTIEQLQKPPVCNVCTGLPLASGGKCICGGIGTEQAELHGFRVKSYDDDILIAEQAQRIQELEAVLRAIRGITLRGSTRHLYRSCTDSDSCSLDLVKCGAIVDAALARKEGKQ